MHKRDAPAAGAGARHVVDQAVPGHAARRDGSVQVRYAVADVVNPRPALREEAGNRASGIRGLEQFDFGITEGQGNDSRAIGQFLLVGLEAEDVAIESQGLADVVDGDPDMRDAGGVPHVDAPVSDSQRDNLTAGCHCAHPDAYQMESVSLMSQNTLAVTDSSFSSEVEQARGLVLVDFWATWCGPCQIVAPVLDQLAQQYAGKAKVTKLDVDNNQRTAMRFNVRSIPSILFFKDGKHVDTVVGALPKASIESKIQQHLAA